MAVDRRRIIEVRPARGRGYLVREGGWPLNRAPCLTLPEAMAAAAEYALENPPAEIIVYDRDYRVVARQVIEGDPDCE